MLANRNWAFFSIGLGLFACSEAPLDSAEQEKAGTEDGVSSSGGAASGGRTQQDSASGGEGGTGADSASGGADGESPEEEPGGSKLSALFVAQGHLGRTVVSCDQGRSWTGERTSVPVYEDQDTRSLRCFDDIDCDHKGHPGRGIIGTDQGFFATFGWGEPGQVQRSLDGVTWEVVLEGTTFGGLATAQGAIVAGARDARRSTDQGATWAEPVRSIEGYNARRVGFTASHGGRILILGEAGDAALSSDGGLSFHAPKSYPQACGDNIQTRGGIASLGDIWLVMGGDGLACRSTDGGETWLTTSLGSEVNSHLVASDKQFLVFASGGKRFSSSDGESWKEDQMSPSNLSLGAVAVAPSGEMVGVNGGWKNWYEKQVFYWSDDGLNWVEASSFEGGHPIRAIAFGFGELPEDCRL